ncbi:MAG: hypothetical protein PHV37_01815 [Candidatus Gastranaerophilales bacterium]|nr:hypothetical protein [Candidatus Gastranaerophilales bacterium]
MVNPIIMQIKMQLETVKKAYKEDELKLIRALNELSDYVNPFFGDDLDLLKADEIEQVGDEIKALKEKLVKNQILIKRLKTELGE